MKAALLDTSYHLSVVDKPLRRLQDNEALVKVNICGVCGTDLHILEGKSRSRCPVVLGHEFTGIIYEIGEKNGLFKEGQPVAIDPNISCGMCYYCHRGLVHLCKNLKALGVDIDGGMAEYCIVPVSQIYPVPHDMSQEKSVFIEPVSCIIHGIDRARITVGDIAVIIGGGTIGLLMIPLLKNAGVSKTILIEPVTSKRERAVDLGADVVLDPGKDNLYDAVFDSTQEGADIVMECAGTPNTAKQAFEFVRRGGTIEFFGVCPKGETIPVEPYDVFSNELTILGSYVNPHTFSRAIRMLEAGIIDTDKLLTGKYKLEDVHGAIDSLRSGEAVKNVVYPG